MAKEEAEKFSDEVIMISDASSLSEEKLGKFSQRSQWFIKNMFPFYDAASKTVWAFPESHWSLVQAALYESAAIEWEQRVLAQKDFSTFYQWGLDMRDSLAAGYGKLDAEFWLPALDRMREGMTLNHLCHDNKFSLEDMYIEILALRVSKDQRVQPYREFIEEIWRDFDVQMRIHSDSHKEVQAVVQRMQTRVNKRLKKGQKVVVGTAAGLVRNSAAIQLTDELTDNYQTLIVSIALNYTGEDSVLKFMNNLDGRSLNKIEVILGLAPLLNNDGAMNRIVPKIDDVAGLELQEGFFYFDESTNPDKEGKPYYDPDNATLYYPSLTQGSAEDLALLTPAIRQALADRLTP